MVVGPVAVYGITSLADLAVIVPKAYRDDRGFFAEVYREDQFAALGLNMRFVQDNHSCSRKGVVRGLHFQWAPPMGKLMRVTRGTAFLVAVGALNWGLVAVARFDLVAALFGLRFGEVSAPSAVVYALVGLAGVYQVLLWKRIQHRWQGSPMVAGAN